MIAALFLIVVLAALGAFAFRLGADQQQTANLQLTQYRALAAATSGLEYWAYVAKASNAVTPCPAAPLPLNFAGIRGLRNFTVTLSCTRIASGGAAVYEVTADAIAGNYGEPDFVRRQLTRRITNVAAGTWD